MLLAAGFGAFACGPEQQAYEMTFVEYASDGSYTERRAQTAVDVKANWQVSSTPLLTLARAGTDELGLPVDALRLPNGTLVVADKGSASLHWYDSQGNHVVAIGGRGGGPGEFESLNWISGWRGDSVVAYDGRLMRISVFDAQGEFHRVISGSQISHLSNYGLLGMIDDQTALAFGLSTPEARQSQAGLQRWRRDLTLIDLVTGAQHELQVFAETVYYGHEYPSNPGYYLAIPVPFEPLAEYGAGSGILVAGQTSAFDLSAYSAGGKQLWNVSVAVPPTRATSSHRRWAQGTLEGWVNSPVVRSTIRSARGKMHYGEYLPAFGRRAWERRPKPSYPGVVSILIDEKQNVWLLKYDHEETKSRSWLVLSSEGRWIGTVKMPAHFEPFSIGADYILGWREESSGAIIVAMYALEKQLS
jgi:hypothetical protein